MSIIVNGRFLQQPITGVQRFAREVCGAGSDSWLKFSGSEKIKIVYPASGGEPDLTGIDLSIFEAVPLNGFRGHLWEQVILSRFEPESTLLNLCGTAPAFRRNQLVVLHDAAVMANPNNFSFVFRSWYQVMVGCYSRFSRRLLTVSEFSRSEIVRYWNSDRSRWGVVSESGEHILRCAANNSILDRHGLIKNGFVLAVSSMSPNKNFGLVVQAMNEISDSDVLLVVAGGDYSKVFSGVSFGNNNNVIRVGYVSDGELRALYENAVCFVYPSKYEGFGLPPLEAMECGCPVIVSNSSSLPEVCGDAAMYCNPNDHIELAAGLRKLWDSEELRAAYRVAGKHRADRFSWDACAQNLLAYVSS